MKIYRIDQKLPKLILEWYAQNKRDLPWRKNKEPYDVWLSEIMLQQTRVETVKPYYERFLLALPTVAALAAAGEEQLLKLWQGLGYYSRARHLQKAARVVMEEYGGVFPCEYEQILKLPGVGPYTAGAIASICFDMPAPAVDGNVLRVIARIEGIKEDVTKPGLKKAIADALAPVYPNTDRGDFTQGLMELGATICVPGGKPKCGECPANGICKAFQNGLTGEIPAKRPRSARKREPVTVLLLLSDGKLAVRKRGETGLLKGLWEFPNQTGRLTERQALSLAEEWGAKPEKTMQTMKKTHIFTHIEWEMRFYLISCEEQPECFRWASREELQERYAIPAAFWPPGFPDLNQSAQKMQKD